MKLFKGKEFREFKNPSPGAVHRSDILDREDEAKELGGMFALLEPGKHIPLHHHERRETIIVVITGEAMEMIEADRFAAADVLIAARGDAGLSRDELAALLADPEIEFTTTPANTMRYAEFMHSIGSIDTEPDSWQALFFPEIHDLPGS